MVISSSSTLITIYGNIDKVRINFDILDLNNKYLKVLNNGNDES
jgi:hypothetical protein